MPDHPILPPPRQVRQLSFAQRSKLHRHLGQRLELHEIERVLASVDEWLLLDLPSEGDRELVEAMLTFDAERWGRVAKHARALLDELYGSPPLLDVNGVQFAGNFRAPAKGELETLAEYAAGAATVPKRRRGAPRIEWREELVSLVYAHYPANKRSKTEFGHFEETIALLFGFLGVTLSDLHKEVCRILKRNPEPPFIITEESSLLGGGT